jgi:hypothetical protein
MRMVIYESPCAPRQAGPQTGLTGASDAILCGTTADRGKGPAVPGGSVGSASAEKRAGGVVCICGNDMALHHLTRRFARPRGHCPDGQGLGRQRTNSHSGINLCHRANGPEFLGRGNLQDRSDPSPGRHVPIERTTLQQTAIGHPAKS